MQEKLVEHVDEMSHNRLPIILKRNYRPTGRRDQGRPPKRLLDVSDRNRSTGGPTACWLGDYYYYYYYYYVAYNCVFLFAVLERSTQNHNFAGWSGLTYVKCVREFGPEDGRKLRNEELVACTVYRKLCG
jgi:hypothetical protein